MPQVVPHAMPHSMPQVQLQSHGNAQPRLPSELVVFGAPPQKRARNMPASFAAERSAAPPAAVDNVPAAAQPAIALDPAMLTQEQREAADRALRGESLFITGAAGTGKSFLLRFVIQELSKARSEVAVTAPTGLAAVNIGGITVHSFSGIGMMGGQLKDKSFPARYLLHRIRNAEATHQRWLST